MVEGKEEVEMKRKERESAHSIAANLIIIRACGAI